MPSQTLSGIAAGGELRGAKGVSLYPRRDPNCQGQMKIDARQSCVKNPTQFIWHALIAV
jgi:hypothetical protein